MHTAGQQLVDRIVVVQKEWKHTGDVPLHIKWVPVFVDKPGEIGQVHLECDRRGNAELEARGSQVVEGAVLSGLRERHSNFGLLVQSPGRDRKGQVTILRLDLPSGRTDHRSR